MTDPANPATPRGPGYGSRCKACNTPHRAAIDARLLAGESSRAVSAWLAETHGERIPHQGLVNHKSEHLDAKHEAVARMMEAAPVFEAAVNRVVADAHVLDEVASIGLRVARALEAHVSNPSAKVSQPMATVFAAALTNARSAVTDRHEMLHGKKVEVTGDGASEDIDALYSRVAALATVEPDRDDAGATGGADPGATG